MQRAMTTGRLLAMSAVLVLGLAACSQANQVAAVPEPQGVTVTADDAGWTTTGISGLRAGWVSFTFETLEGQADHSFQLIRLKNGATVDEALQEDDFEPFLEMAEPIGGFVGVTGAESHTLFVRLDAGSYGMFDFGETHEGPNFLRGMTASFQVEPDDGTAGVEPASDGEIVRRDFAIDLPEGFTGRGTYLVRNTGAVLHELNIGRLAPGADAEEELRRHAETGRGRIHEVPGVAMIGPGRDAYVELDLADASYAFACFVGTPPDEEPHVLKGMYAPVTVG